MNFQIEYMRSIMQRNPVGGEGLFKLNMSLLEREAKIGKPEQRPSNNKSQKKKKRKKK